MILTGKTTGLLKAYGSLQSVTLFRVKHLTTRSGAGCWALMNPEGSRIANAMNPDPRRMNASA